MSHIQARSNFLINADKIIVEGRHTDPHSEIDLESGGKAIRFYQALDVNAENGSFIQGKKGQQLIKDETGNAVMEIKSDGNLKCLVPIDFNNQAPVNFTGGGGGGATTTSGIDSENLIGQTLEDELDQMTSDISNNTNNVTALQTQQQANTTAIGNNSTNITTLTTDVANNSTNITNNTNAVNGMLLQQQTNTNNIATNTGAITGLQTTTATNANNITTLTTDVATNSGDITALQTQQNLNVAAIASNTARTSNLTANRVLVSSATGTINTAPVGVTDLATLNSSNIFNAPLGNPPTQNSFDTVSASTITNIGVTESLSYTQGGAALNYSHLAGTVDKTDLPVEAVRTDVADQTIQGTGTSGAQTKITIDNTHTSGNSQLVLQKRSTAGVLEGGITIQQTVTGTNISGSAAAGQQPDISITPANGSLAMTIGGLETRCHNNFRILGSLGGAARSDNKDYIFKTIGSNGTGDTLLLEDVIQRPTQGNPAQGFNPSANSLLQIDTSGVPSYKNVTDFLALPAGLPTNPSAVLIDSAGATSYLDSQFVLTKPGGQNPSVASFVEVNTGGTFSYRPASFLPLPGGSFPASNENVCLVNPAGTSYTERSNFIERPGNANPTSGTKLITINNVGTRAYKDLGQFITTPNNANPSSDSVVQITSTGVQSYVPVSSLGGGGIQKPGGANPGQQSLISIDTAGTETYLAESNLIKTNIASQTISTTTAAANFTLSCGSTTLADETVFRVERTGGVGDNHIEFRPKRGTFAEWECKNDLRILINGGTKMGVGNHSVDFFKPLVMQNGQDIRMNQTFSAPANSSSTGSAGTLGYDSNYLYIAVGTNSWKRLHLSTF